MGFAVSKAFKSFLEFEAFERIVTGDVFGVDLYDHAGVGKRRVAMAGTHSVDHTCSCAASSRHYVSAGAHAERIDTAAIDLRDEGIGGIADVVDKPIPRPLALKGRGEMVHEAVDEGLRMFGSYSHRKAFGL